MSESTANIEALFAITPSTVRHTAQSCVPYTPAVDYSYVVSPAQPEEAPPPATSFAAPNVIVVKREPSVADYPGVLSTIKPTQLPRPMALPFLLPAAKRSSATHTTVNIALGRQSNGGDVIRYDRVRSFAIHCRHVVQAPHFLHPPSQMPGFEPKRVRLAGHTSLVTVQVPVGGRGAIPSLSSPSPTDERFDDTWEAMPTVQTSMYSADKLVGVVDERYEPTTRLWQHLLEVGAVHPNDHHACVQMLTQPDMYGKQVVRFAQDEQRVNDYEIVILDPDMLAHLWGVRRGCSRMTYEKLSRSLRYYAPRDMLHKSPRRLHWVLGTRLIEVLNAVGNADRVRWVGADLPDKWKYAYLGEIRKEHDKKIAVRRKQRQLEQNGFPLPKTEVVETDLIDMAVIVDEDEHIIVA